MVETILLSGNNLKIDSEFKALIPRLTNDEYKLLEQSILSEGCRDALVIWQGILIDGHHRYEICTKHNKPFKTIEKQFEDRVGVKRWIIDNQLGRRNITPEQRNYLIGKRYELEKKAVGRPEIVSSDLVVMLKKREKRERRKIKAKVEGVKKLRKPKQDKPKQEKKRLQNEALKTRDKIAKQVKASDSTIERAAKFAEAVDKLAEVVGEEVKQKILSREIDVSQKDVLFLAKKEPEQQKKIVEEITVRPAKDVKELYTEIVKEEKQAKLLAEVKQKSSEYKGIDDVQILCGDFRETSKQIADNSIDLILTDPPYGKEHLELWHGLGKIAKRVLKSDGFLVAYSGQAYLPEVMAFLSKELSYFWTIALQHSGSGNIINYKNVINDWKPILVFYKEPMKKIGTFHDLIEGRKEKSYHEWEQSTYEAQELIKVFSKVGDSILDPMAGSGVVLIASYIEKRKAIGIEIKPENVELIKGRLTDVQRKTN